MQRIVKKTINKYLINSKTKNYKHTDSNTTSIKTRIKTQECGH